MKTGRRMSPGRFLRIIVFCLAAFGPGLFSQITLEGVVRDNGAEPVENAFVELTDQADPGRYFSDYTDREGQYVVRITDTGTHDDRHGITSLFTLSQNYPNPFNPSTVIAYEIIHPADLRITIHDILGRKIKTLFEGFHSGLSGSIVWDATDDEGRGVPAGIYIYSLNMEGIRLNKKMLLLDGCLSGSSQSLSRPAVDGTALLKKMSDQYSLRITGPDVENHEQQNLQITGNTALDVTVYRTVTDIDGHVYRTIKIFDQWWMAENLKVTHYRNGEAIPNVADNTAWSTLTAGSICEYGNDPFYSFFYGYLYNWHAMNDGRGVAPAGWRVPGEAEWRILVDRLGGDAVAGGKMKETATAHWISPNTGATDESGFSGLPGGFRDDGGAFSEPGRLARFWSSTESDSGRARHYGLIAGDSGVIRGDGSRLYGCSIRCVKGAGMVEAPAFDPPPGTYPAALTVAISCPTEGATLHFTIDGRDPVESDSTYAGPVPITDTSTLKARAYKTGWSASEAAGGAYTIALTVAAPAFDPPPGTYTTAQTVGVSCSTPGVAIHYTTNGMDPVESDSIYSHPVPIDSTATLKVMACRAGWVASAVVSGTYTITGTVAAPTFDPPPGAYPAAQTVGVSCSTPGVAIHYTTNGMDPVESDSIYNHPVTIDSTITLKAMACRAGWVASMVVSGTYTITGTVAAPTFDPPPGAYPATQTVTIRCSTEGAAIHYTTNGTDPVESDSIYSRPVPIDSAATLKAMACRAGWVASTVVSGTYTITSTVAAPTFDPPPGTYPAKQTVTIHCSTEGAAIHYTTNGTDPVESDSIYTHPVPIGSGVTLKARAYRSGWIPSEAAGGTYTAANTVTAPVFVPSPGTFSAAQTITIVCSTPGATVHYTTNGSDPTESSAAYRSPVFMPHTAVLKARGYRSGWNPSAVTGGKYTVNTTAVYCMGNSITAAGKYERTLNDLLGFSWGVLNLGISGQTTAQMLSRFNRDVIAPGDAKYVIVLGGVNDIRYGLTAAQIIPNLQSMYTSAHYAGIKVVAVSILPFGKNNRDRGWTPEKQVVLDEVNAWISSSAAHVDYRVNAYTSLEDPANPDCLLPAYDDGDGLHPSYAGYIVLANAIYHAVSWSH